jgi:hypothetical protein
MKKFLFALLLMPCFVFAREQNYVAIVHNCVEETTMYTEFAVYAKQTSTEHKDVYDRFVSEIVSQNSPNFRALVNVVANLAWANRPLSTHVTSVRFYDNCMKNSTPIT